MDPDVTFRTLNDENATLGERREAARNLLTWLYGGGFVPAGWYLSREELITTCQLMRGGTKHMTSPPPDPPLDPDGTLVPPD